MVPHTRLVSLICTVFISVFWSLSATEIAPEPVTEDAIPEVHAVLDFLKSISGEYTLTGQHNYPNTHTRNSDFLYEYTGKYPVVYSTDWGFAEDGDTDSYLARPDIVQEAIRQHRNGALVTICWHAVPPTADEPITFRPLAEADPTKLESVQGKLLDEQWRALFDPETELYAKWCQQVDAIAVHLKALEKAHVPVLWRPYHEMNGNWFWWGGLTGEFSSERLYRQLFDRLVHHHQLKNLIWVWNVDRLSGQESRAYELYYPGDEYLDIVSLDVYRNDFAQEYYDQLEDFAGEKVMLFGEVGNPPALEVYETQPKWTLYTTWAGMVRNTTKKQYDVLYESKRILNLKDRVYQERLNPFRARMGLETLVLATMTPVDFSGKWVYDECASTLDYEGSSRSPVVLKVEDSEVLLTVETTQIIEWEGPQTRSETFKTDGSNVQSTYWNRPMVTTVNRSEDGQQLEKVSRISFEQGGNTTEAVTREIWHLRSQGEQLVIEQTSTSPWGAREIMLVYDRVK